MLSSGCFAVMRTGLEVVCADTGRVARIRAPPKTTPRAAAVGRGIRMIFLLLREFFAMVSPHSGPTRLGAAVRSHPAPMLDSFRRFLDSLSTAQTIALGVVLLAIVGAVDYFTGYELSFSVFYLVPIVVVTW